jgi:signal transduction histidine kinase
VLIVEQEDGSAGGRDVVEEGQEGLVGWFAETEVEGSEVFRWCVVERLPAAGAFEMREGNAIVEAEQTAGNALAEVREVVSCYRAEGLDAEISHARRSLLSGDVRLTTTFAPVNLSSIQVNVLCLALRGAVTNIVRHAHATVCHLVLLEKDRTIHFIIEDNGLGGQIRQGNGLRGMRERLQSVAGTMKLTGSGNGGTRLELTLPMESESSVEPASQIVGEADAL